MVRAGVEPAGALAVEDHVERRAVLHGTAGVEVFGFAVDLDAGEVGGDIFQADQGSIADGVEQGLGVGAGQFRDRQDLCHEHLIRFSFRHKGCVFAQQLVTKGFAHPLECFDFTNPPNPSQDCWKS